MTDLYTKLPAVEAAIVEILSNAEDLEGVEIGAELEPKSAEYVWVYKSESNLEFLGLGHRPAHLREELKLYLRTFATGGGTFAEIKERVDALGRAVVTALREDIKLGNTVEFHRVENVRREAISLDNRQGFHALMTIEAKTRI